MDNLSQDIDENNQEKEEKEINLQNSEIQEVSDIQFEEIADTDEILQKINQNIEEGTLNPELPKELKDENSESKPKTEQAADNEIKEEVEQNILEIVNPLAEIDSNAKKYVIYVDSDNIDFMENLSIEQRREIINKILKEQNELAIKTKELEERKHFLRHAILATLTFIIGFPIMFLVVNKAMEITINNYQQAKENFSKLYKEKGKIKRSYKDISSTF